MNNSDLTPFATNYILDICQYDYFLEQEKNGFVLSIQDLNTWLSTRVDNNITHHRIQFITMIIFHCNFEALLEKDNIYYHPWASSRCMPHCFKPIIIALFIRENELKPIDDLFLFVKKHNNLQDFVFHKPDEYTNLFSILYGLTCDQQRLFQNYATSYCRIFFDYICEINKTFPALDEFFTAVVLFNYEHATANKQRFHHLLAKPENLILAKAVYDSLSTGFESRFHKHCYISPFLLTDFFKLPTFASIVFKEGNKQNLRYCDIQKHITEFPDLFV